MFRHVLLWRIREGVNGHSKDEAIDLVSEKVLAVKDKIPQIRSIEVGKNRAHVDYACDMAVLLDFDTWDDLVAFTQHPEHRALAESVAVYQDAHFVVDYER